MAHIPFRNSSRGGYRHFKYYMLVKYLIDVKRLRVEEVFTRNFARSHWREKSQAASSERETASLVYRT
jgi:hypothetical protein